MHVKQSPKKSSNGDEASICVKKIRTSYDDSRKKNDSYSLLFYYINVAPTYLTGYLTILRAQNQLIKTFYDVDKRKLGILRLQYCECFVRLFPAKSAMNR